MMEIHAIHPDEHLYWDNRIEFAQAVPWERVTEMMDWATREFGPNSFTLIQDFPVHIGFRDPDHAMHFRLRWC